MKEKIKYYLNPENRDTSFFFNHVHTISSNQVTLHEQDSWELSYVITGKGVRVAGDNTEPFSAGEIIFIPPNMQHCWYFDESEYDELGKIENISIAFHNDLLEGIGIIFTELSYIVAKIRENKYAISFSGDTLTLLQGLMKSMVMENSAERIATLIRIFQEIAYSENISTVVGRPIEEDKEKRRMQNLYLYVMKNYRQNITLSDVANFTDMEKSSFCAFFKRKMGKSFFLYLTEYRIESSCQMLLQTTKSIAEICFESGFRDVPYYNRTFKKMKGICPSKYRVRFQQKPSK